MEKKPVMEYVNEAKTEAEKPIKRVNLYYSPSLKKMFAIVEFDGLIGKRTDTIYDINAINYYLDCLKVQEGVSIKDLVNNKNPRIMVSSELLDNEKINVNYLGEDEELSFDLENGKFNKSKKDVKKDGETKDETVDSEEIDDERESATKEDKKTIIKKLKIVGGVILATVLVSVGYHLGRFGGKTNNNDNKDYDNDSKIDSNIDETDLEVNNNLPDDEILINGMINQNQSYRNDNYYYGSCSDEDMRYQIQRINDICFQYQNYNLENSVSDFDRNSIAVISDLRNRTLNGTYERTYFLNNMVHYIFEEGANIDGNFIKTFDSLSPYSQYIVLVSSQSILEMIPDYNHYNGDINQEYNYTILTTAFRNILDSCVREMGISETKTY